MLHVKLDSGVRKYKGWLAFFYLSLLIFTPTRAHAQFAFQVAIDSPSRGEAVQGVVPITGTSSVEDFLSYQLEFALSDDLSQSWFMIIDSKEAVRNELLGEWDTTNLTDGRYQLRLTVQRDGEDSIIVLVEDIRLRNYTPIETNTPSPTLTQSPGQTLAPTETHLPPTPTLMPTNPAVLNQIDIRDSVLSGAIGAFLALLMVGFYSASRNRKRER